MSVQILIDKWSFYSQIYLYSIIAPDIYVSDEQREFQNWLADSETCLYTEEGEF